MQPHVRERVLGLKGKGGKHQNNMAMEEGEGEEWMNTRRGGVGSLTLDYYYIEKGGKQCFVLLTPTRSFFDFFMFGFCLGLVSCSWRLMSVYLGPC